MQSHMTYSSCSCFCLLDRTIPICVSCFRAVKIWFFEYNSLILTTGCSTWHLMAKNSLRIWELELLLSTMMAEAIRSLLQIVSCECTVGGARPSTIDAWQCFLLDIHDCIKEWLLCFYCPSLSPSLLIGLWYVEYVFCFVIFWMLCCVMCEKIK